MHPWVGKRRKKLPRPIEIVLLCKDKISSLKEKVKIFGKSELQIGALIHRALGVDLGVYVGSENLAICRLCYNMLNAYNKALKKVNQIVDGIKQKIESNGPLRTKRLSKDSTKAPEARKSLRGCLGKNRPLNFAWKIILPETLARLSSDGSSFHFGLLSFFLFCLPSIFIFTYTYVLKIGTIFGPHTVPLKVWWPATPLIIKNLVFSDYAMKMTVDAPV